MVYTLGALLHRALCHCPAPGSLATAWLHLRFILRRPPHRVTLPSSCPHPLPVPQNPSRAMLSSLLWSMNADDIVRWAIMHHRRILLHILLRMIHHVLPQWLVQVSREAPPWSEPLSGSCPGVACRPSPGGSLNSNSIDGSRHGFGDGTHGGSVGPTGSPCRGPDPARATGCGSSYASPEAGRHTSVLGGAGGPVRTGRRPCRRISDGHLVAGPRRGRSWERTSP